MSEVTIEPTPNWEKFIERLSPIPPGGRWLSLDPGDTTGWCWWSGSTPLLCGQAETKEPKDLKNIPMLLESHFNTWVVESYHIYGWMLKEHSFSDVPTLQLIGALRWLAEEQKSNLIFQGATAKTFASDDKLKLWGLYQKGNPHANDAIRHGVYFLT